MLKKVTHIFTILLILAITAGSVFAGGQPPPPSNKNGNFSKKQFSNSNSFSREGKSLAPPDPDGTGSTGGNRIPISGGLAFLLLGSTAYLLKRVRDEKQ